MLTEGKITLRPLQDHDRDALAQLANNKKIWDNLRDILPHPYTPADADAFIQLTRQEKEPMTFAIAFDQQFCGIIGLVGQTDIYRKTAEIGYWIGEPFWKRGIATTAVKLITAYGLHQLGFLRIHTGIFEYNPGSMRVLEKNGYEKDGIFRKSLVKNGQIWDEHRYSIIK
ncbi:GNAT family N-acetyltransferase [Sabulibacter ruber]|uniref:GNAT family N-acetyltransferase n=1 Tax=Sabulibacter ruber TaxID=2811901 RepID=UPI001A962592|nr:GNAT family protein [Sabulibacter ruber]